MKTPKPSSPLPTKERLSLLLQESSERFRYISLAWIREHLAQGGRVVSPTTLRGYLSEAMANGEIHSAGRGWYSALATPAALDAGVTAEFRALLAKRFPLLPHYVWSTRQINPWLHHTLGKETLFAHVQNDAIADVTAFLRQEGWTVMVNPTKKTGTDFLAGDRVVVLRGVRREIGTSNEPSVERVLIDLFLENRRLGFMDESDRREAPRGLISAMRVDMGLLVNRLNKHASSMKALIGTPLEPTIGEK